MTSLRPSYHGSTSHSKWDKGLRDNKERLSGHHLPIQAQYTHPNRAKSPSRVLHPYTSNCGRRRWPPSPKIEEVKYEEEIPMRGEIGQDPMIIDVPHFTSIDSGSTYSRDSVDSSEPDTPPTSDSDRRYVWKPEPNTPISQAYDTARNTGFVKDKGAVGSQDRGRGRKAMPKLDTDLGRAESTGGPPPQLERARSPYASGPQDRRPKLKPDRFSAEYLLSPDVMSPRRSYRDSPRTQSQYFPRPVDIHTNAYPAQGKEVPRQPLRSSIQNQRCHPQDVSRPAEGYSVELETQGKNSPSVSARPSLGRRASELPFPSNAPPASSRATQERNPHKQSGRPSTERRATELPYPVAPPSTSAVRPQSRRPTGSHDDSDSDHARHGSKPTRASPQNPPLHQTTTFKEGRHHQRQFSSELPASSPRRSMPSSSADGPPVNLSSLVSGAAIHQTLAAMLNRDQFAGRRASPRPSPGPSPSTSPRDSPKASPYSSPPRTPPSEPSYHRGNPVAGRKRDSPKSGPSSPLSSRSSTWTMEPDRDPSESDSGKRSRPAPPKSMRTAPLPPPKIKKSEKSEPSTPGIYVRSASPAQHAEYFSAEAGGPRHSKTTSGPGLRKEPAPATNLRPTGFSGRPRSASSADVRPQLTVNSAPFLQESESSSPASRSRPPSPNIVSPSDRYKPSNFQPQSPAVRSSSSYPEAASSHIRHRSRSRSHIPEATQATPIIHTNALDPAGPTPRPRPMIPSHKPVDTRLQSSSYKPMVPASLPMQPTSLPLCPRPHPVTGYDDWYTLTHNTAFTICPGCRDNVFGSSHEQYLQPRPVASSKKTLCDLNNPWIRLACLIRGPDVELLSALSDVTSKERACPGDELAPRDWYRLEDCETGNHLSGVNACPHCVHSLGVLFPPWRDVFYQTRTSRQHILKERFCSLRSSGVRFGDYLDMIVESSREAESKKRSPNTKAVCDLAKQLAAIDDCPRDKMNARKAWHVHPHLPEFTICQDCYETVVYPLVKTGSPLAAKIDKKPQQFPNPDVKCCCNLYSPRMRKVFREACEDDDYEHLRHTVLKRHMLQQDLLETLGEKDAHPRDEEVTDRLQELVARWKEKE